MSDMLINFKNSPFGEVLITQVSELFELSGVPNVLYGSCLLQIYGVPLGVGDISFAIPDPKIPTAKSLLTTSTLTPCIYKNTCPAFTSSSSIFPPPEEHFHLHPDLHQLTLRLYRLSLALPGILSISNPRKPDSIITVSDPRIPPASVFGGCGPFMRETLFPVRIPSPVCFVDACLEGYFRGVTKGVPNPDYGNNYYPNAVDADIAIDANSDTDTDTDTNSLPENVHDEPAMTLTTYTPDDYMDKIAYMMDHVYTNGFLNLDDVSPPFKTFLVDTFLMGDETRGKMKEELDEFGLPCWD